MWCEIKQGKHCYTFFFFLIDKFTAFWSWIQDYFIVFFHMQNAWGFHRLKMPFNFYEAVKNKFTMTAESGVDKVIWGPHKLCIYVSDGIVPCCTLRKCPWFHTQLFFFFFSICQEQLDWFKGTSFSHGKYQECRVHICKCNL